MIKAVKHSVLLLCVLACLLTAAGCGKDAVKAGFHAGNILKQVSAVAGGKGGGRPDSAMSGGSDFGKIDDALAEAAKILG